MNRKCFMLILLIVTIITIGCDGDYQYEELIYNMKHKTLSLDEGSNFVIDSVVMKHKNKVLYNLFLTDKKKGLQHIDLNGYNTDYETSINNLDEVCNQDYNDNWQGITIWIRNKSYYWGNRYKDRDSIQIFGNNRFPCDTLKMVLKARRRR